VGPCEFVAVSVTQSPCRCSGSFPDWHRQMDEINEVNEMDEELVA